ncbi:MAG: glycosyltransferase [Candidatus Krumholzibacteria bacterium]|nr:glycosyltransferase [Candidatus Krumholzibacteria bacterium]
MGTRIALLLPNLGGGGAQRVIVNLAGGFARRGLGTDVVAVRAAGPLLADLPPRARLIDLGSRSTFAALPRLIRYIRRERPAAMLSTMSHCNVVALLARRLSRPGMRLVVREATTLDWSRRRPLPVNERAVRVLMERLYPGADLVVANSHGTAADLVGSGIVPGDRVRVIHNPVVCDEIFEKQREAAPHRWLQGGGIPVLIAVGRLHESKDHATAIRAFAAIRRDRAARLVILGEGPERGRLLELADELHVAEDLDLPGFTANPHAWLARASALVCSSRWEGFGNVLVEALAAGTPVISTDCPGGPGEILGGGRFGRLVPVGDHEALARSIVETLDDPPGRDLLVERAMDFTIDRISSLYLEALEPETPA